MLGKANAEKREPLKGRAPFCSGEAAVWSGSGQRERRETGLCPVGETKGCPDQQDIPDQGYGGGLGATDGSRHARRTGRMWAQLEGPPREEVRKTNTV